jgi:hypothetical protein
VAEFPIDLAVATPYTVYASMLADVDKQTKFPEIVIEPVMFENTIAFNDPQLAEVRIKKFPEIITEPAIVTSEFLLQ